MITMVQFDDRPMEAGEQRVLLALATEPLKVQIECFRQPPQPPQLRPCAECGSFPLREGEPLAIRASADVFGERGGFLAIRISDASGDSRTIRVVVTATTNTSSFGGGSVASSS